MKNSSELTDFITCIVYTSISFYSLWTFVLERGVEKKMF